MSHLLVILDDVAFERNSKFAMYKPEFRARVLREEIQWLHQRLSKCTDDAQKAKLREEYDQMTKEFLKQPGIEASPTQNQGVGDQP